MTYKPLPDNVTIKESKIQGLGLFATQDIQSDTTLGLSHIHKPGFENDYIRTPLGGFINHSENPNCKTIKTDEYLYIKSIKNIRDGEELTLKYTLYSC